jgi:hypothetical protein
VFIDDPTALQTWRVELESAHTSSSKQDVPSSPIFNKKQGKVKFHRDRIVGSKAMNRSKVLFSSRHIENIV